MFPLRFPSPSHRSRFLHTLREKVTILFTTKQQEITINCKVTLPITKCNFKEHVVGGRRYMTTNKTKPASY